MLVLLFAKLFQVVCSSGTNRLTFQGDNGAYRKALHQHFNSKPATNLLHSEIKSSILCSWFKDYRDLMKRKPSGHFPQVCLNYKLEIVQNSCNEQTGLFFLTNLYLSCFEKPTKAAILHVSSADNTKSETMDGWRVKLDEN